MHLFLSVSETSLSLSLSLYICVCVCVCVCARVCVCACFAHALRAGVPSRGARSRALRCDSERPRLRSGSRSAAPSCCPELWSIYSHTRRRYGSPGLRPGTAPDANTAATRAPTFRGPATTRPRRLCWAVSGRNVSHCLFVYVCLSLSLSLSLSRSSSPPGVSISDQRILTRAP
jgi:hypothetical protein